MKLVLSLILSIANLLVASAEPGTQNELEKRAVSNERATFPIPDGWTIPNCLELKWVDGDRSTLPATLFLKNPFQDDLIVPAVADTLYFYVEYYDPYISAWRARVRIPGSFGPSDKITLKYGDSKILSLSEDFWEFLEEEVPRLTSSNETRVRVALSLDGVVLRSAEFKWNTKRPNKAEMATPRKPSD